MFNVYVPVHFRGVTLHIKTSEIVNSPAWLRSVVFYGFDEIIGDNFCSRELNIRTISYRGMTSLRKVGNWWMRTCIALIRVDFEGLNSLRTVGVGWMYDCISLITINFEGLNNLQQVGEGWMAHCEVLTTIHFEGLNSLRTIHSEGFMSMCFALRTLNINRNQASLFPHELRGILRIV
jgi:hypothetical protein